METAAAQLFTVKESLHHLRDCIVFNRQPFKTLQEGCRYAYDQDHDLSCSRVSSHHLFHGSFRRRRAMITREELEEFIEDMI